MGLSLSFTLATESKSTGKCEKDGFDFIFQSTFSLPGRRRALLSASPPDVWTTARTAVLGVPSKRPIRAGCRDSSRQHSAGRSGQHCRAEWLLGPSFDPFTNLPLFCSFLTSVLQRHPSKHLLKWRLDWFNQPVPATRAGHPPESLSMSLLWALGFVTPGGGICGTSTGQAGLCKTICIILLSLGNRFKAF